MDKFIAIKEKDNVRAINLHHISDITISCNWLKLTTTGGLEARDISLVYGTEKELNDLYEAVMDFIANPNAYLFRCEKWLADYRGMSH